MRKCFRSMLYYAERKVIFWHVSFLFCDLATFFHLVSKYMWPFLTIFLFVVEVAVDKTKSFCPMVGCDGICSGIPGASEPTTCQEVITSQKGNSFKLYSKILSTHSSLQVFIRCWLWLDVTWQLELLYLINSQMVNINYPHFFVLE